MDHKDLEAWKQAVCLVEEIYKISATFPKQETYGLTSQLRRAAVSIPSNISEGAARNGRKEYSNFLGHYCPVKLSNRFNWLPISHSSVL